MLTKLLLNGLYFSRIDTMLAPYMQGIGGIWMLHRVNNSVRSDFSPNAHLSISPEFLDMAVFQCKQLGYQFVSMDELVRQLASVDESDKPRRLLSITLDDAYVDNLENAVPVFRRHKVPYTIYVAPGLVDGTHTLWWEDLEHLIASNKKITFKIKGEAKTFETVTPKEKASAYSLMIKCLSSEVSEDEQRDVVAKLCSNAGHDVEAYVKSQILDWEPLRALSRDPLCTLGAHTVGHYAVARLDEASARYEMSESKERLETLTGKSADHFAFPYGSLSAAGPRDYKLADEVGFKSAVTTCHGVVDKSHANRLHSLPRLSINGHFQALRYLRPMHSGVTTSMHRFGQLLKVA